PALPCGHEVLRACDGSVGRHFVVHDLWRDRMPKGVPVLVVISRQRGLCRVDERVRHDTPPVSTSGDGDLHLVVLQNTVQAVPDERECPPAEQSEAAPPPERSEGTSSRT